MTGYRAIRARCAHDKAFRRACIATALANVLLALIFLPLGLLGGVLSLVYVMPRNAANNRAGEDGVKRRY